MSGQYGEWGSSVHSYVPVRSITVPVSSQDTNAELFNLYFSAKHVGQIKLTTSLSMQNARGK
jgi:hypothetical protein